MTFEYKVSRKGAKAQRTKRGLFYESIHYSCDSILDQFFAEINKQTKPFIKQSQMSQNLLLINGDDRLFGLQFNKHLFFNEQISAKAFVEM